MAEHSKNKNPTQQCHQQARIGSKETNRHPAYGWTTTPSSRRRTQTVPFSGLLGVPIAFILPIMAADLNPEALAELLEKLDAVCQQARELSVIIRHRMAQSARDDYPSADAHRIERRKKPRTSLT
jgi:hypothetical protein